MFTQAQEGNFTGTDQGPKASLLGRDPKNSHKSHQREDAGLPTSPAAYFQAVCSVLG